MAKSFPSCHLQPSSIFPSVRCGLEMAILNALAARQGSSLSDLILGYESSTLETNSDKSDKTLGPPSVQICALLDSNGTPKEVAHIVAQLVDEGFTTIKLKVRIYYRTYVFEVTTKLNKVLQFMDVAERCKFIYYFGPTMQLINLNKYEPIHLFFIGSLKSPMGHIASRKKFRSV